jgi:uncharacterized membrane protein
MAVSPFQIMYSQEARVYGLMVLLALVSFYFFVRVLSKERSTPAQVGYVISTSALMYTHVYALFVVLAQNVYLAGAFLGKALGLKTEARPGLERWLFLQACLFVLYVPALFRILGLVQTPVNRWWIKPPSLGSVYRVLVHYSGSPLLLMLLAAFALLAAVALAKSDPGKLCLLLSWLLVPVALPIVISILYQPVFVDRYGITALPAFYLLAAKGVEVASGVVSGALPRRTARAPGGTAVCLAAAALLLMLCAGPLWRYFHEVDKDQWREVAHYVDAHAQAGDLVLLDPPRLQLPFVYNYYSKRKDLVELSAYLPGGGPLLANEAKKHDRVWLVHAHRPRGPLALQQSLFAESHVPVDHRRYKGIDLTVLEKR